MRRCEWCNRFLRAKRTDAYFCDHLCRLANWNHAHGHRVSDLARRRRQNGSERLSGGAQISYRKAVRALAEWIEATQPANSAPEVTAEFVLGPALPERQRVRTR